MASSSNATMNDELEKFKRRMIRAVARKMREGNVAEEEMWSDLKQKTGYDCHLLWFRMRSIALKKLRRMLAAQDRVDDIAKGARMTMTDWLLFDLVLVHEKIDLIDSENRRLGNHKVLKPLTDLFSLIQKFNIEELSGQQLLEAWIAATVYYNNRGHHVTPMLLQKRWYQLKESTRQCFYSFWFSYRGNAKLFITAVAQHNPTMLQIAIARRFNAVITHQFMDWEELIQHGRVILAEEFEDRHRLKHKKADDNAPDFELVEPVIETIDLGVDSDTETNPKDESSQEKTEINTIIKVEPEDKSDVDTDITTNADLQTHKFSLQDYDDFDEEYDDMDAAEQDIDDVQSLLGDDFPSTASNENFARFTCANDQLIATPNDEFTNLHFNVNDSSVPQIPSDELISSPMLVNTTFSEKLKNLAKLVIEETGPLMNDTIPTKEIKTLPQITSVIGNADIIPNFGETISNVELNAEISGAIDNAYNDDVIQINDDEIDENTRLPIPIDGESEAIVDPRNIPIDVIQTIEPITHDKTINFTVDDIIDKTCEKALENLKVNKSVIDDTVHKTEQEKNNEAQTAFGELSSYLNFADDGIELVDDGIAYVDEDNMETENEINKFKEEVSSEEQNIEEADSSKIDLKLLLYPVVYTTKLDHMGITIQSFETVNSNQLLETIFLKSKPVSKKTINLDDIRKENDETNLAISDNMSDDEPTEDLFNNEYRIKLSSYLLQKPRTRNYNPVNLCKNPDFNTRLKRLSVGFFSSSRNRMLLKHCKPLTIDLSKAFEDKLINGTIYLKLNEDLDCKEISDSECPQQASVIPSAMPVQSLIDNQNITNIDTNEICNDLITERNKIINLPDISQVRRQNKRLLVAEVSPIQVRNNMISVPVSIAKSSSTRGWCTTDGNVQVSAVNLTNVTEIDKKDTNVNVTNVTKIDNVQPYVTESQIKNITGMVTTSNTRNMCGPLIKKTFQIANTYDPRKKPSSPWKPLHRSTVSWLGPKKTVSGPVYDALLTVDTLNKMLFILSKEKGERVELMQKSAKQMTRKIRKSLKRKQDKAKKQQELKNQTTNPTQAIMENDIFNDDVQIISDTSEEKQTHDQKICKTKICNLERYCCWARRKLECKKLRKRLNAPHRCPAWACNCCCKHLLVENLNKMPTTDQDLEQACKTIESVVQQTYLNNNDTDSAVKSVIIEEVSSFQNILNTQSSTLESKTKDQEEFKSKNISNIEHDDKMITVIDEEVIITDVIDDIDIPPVATEISLPNTEHLIHSEIGSLTSTTISLPTSIPSPTPIPSPIASPISIPPPTSISVSTSTPSTPTLPFTSITPSEFVDISGDIGVSTATTKPSIVELNPVNVWAGSNRPQTQQVRIFKKKKKENDCKCAPHLSISVDSHKKLVIDGSVSCPVHKHILPKFNSTNAKQIFLDSKHISVKPSPSPIFLGKNQILLTNIKFPPRFHTTQPVQSTPSVKIIPALPLPTGVQLTLLPNGELSYILEPDADVQSLEALPGILEAVKQQLNLTTGLMNTLSKTNISENNEIHTVSDDETDTGNNEIEQTQVSHTANETENNFDSLGVAKKTSDIVESSQIENAKESQNVEHSYTSINTITIESTNENNINIPSEVDNNIEIRLNEQNEARAVTGDKDVEFNINNKNQTITMEEHTIEDNNEMSNEIKCQPVTTIEENEKSSCLNKDQSNSTIKESQMDYDNMTTEKDAIATEILTTLNETEKNVSEKDSMNSKNILSDLMEMSGISAEDITPTITNTPQEVSPNLLIQHELENHMLPQSISAMPMSSELDTNSLSNVTEFTTITSLAELKYARANNGLFFKLDFNTGVIVPINVCIEKKLLSKKVGPTSSFMPTIDLTDDVVDDTDINTPNMTNAKSILIASQKTKNANTSSADSGVKPIKLFKSVHPNILKKSFASSKSRKKKVKVFVVKNLEELKKLNVLKCNITNKRYKPRRRSRKESFETKVDTKIDLVDSDCPMEEEYLESSNSENETRKRNPHSDDSSDEEPLSKIAKKIREPTTSNDNVPTEKAGKDDEAEGNDVSEEQMVLEPESFSMIIDECNDETEEDCILGV